MRVCYFARSIRGSHTSGDKAYEQAIVEQIKAAGWMPALELPGPVGGMSASVSQDKYIYQRDLQWLNQSQALIADVTNPSLGVGYEIAYAQCVVDARILCVARKDANVSAMIRGAFDVIEYRDTSDLNAIIEAFLSETDELLNEVEK